jgi:hypothetical protein
MPSQVGLLQPLFFAVLLGVLAAFFAWMWCLAGSSLQMLVADSFEEVVQGPMVAFGLFVYSPFLKAKGFLLKAGLLHGVLMLVGGNRLGFEATFRVSAYGEAAGILALVPACGGPIGLIWSLVVTIIGLYSIHETEPWRAVVAVLVVSTVCASMIGASIMTFALGMN